MNLTELFNIFIELMLLVIIVIFFIVKRKSGRSLIKIKNFDSILFFVLGIFFLVISICIIFLRRSEEFIFIAVTMSLLSVYLIVGSVMIKNSICEKGIIILNNFPLLIKWSDIQRFGINGKRIYFEKKKGYVSIVANNHNIKHLEEILSAKIEKESL